MSEDKEKKESFFNRLKTEEHRGFEITMFVISVGIALTIVISLIVLVSYFRGAGEKISDEEVNATNVTDAAITVTEVPSETPFDAIISGNEEDYDDNEIDEKLKTSKYGYTTATVNLRDGGSLTASVLMKVPAGAKLKLLELMEDNEWMKVSYNGTVGYINVMYLTATKPAVTATPIPATATPKRTTATPGATATPRRTKNPVKKTKTPVPETSEPEPTDDITTQAPTQAPTAVPATEKPRVTQEPATERPTEPPAATDSAGQSE